MDVPLHADTALICAGGTGSSSDATTVYKEARRAAGGRPASRETSRVRCDWSA